MRLFENMLVIAGMFLVFVFVFSFICAQVFSNPMVPMLCIDIAALLAAYYFYKVWERRAIRLACRECERVISSNSAWVCSVCKKANVHANEFPFVHKCEHCGAEPKAYRCHHKDCGKMIFLTDDHDSTDFAYRVNSEAPVSDSDKEAAARTNKLKKVEEQKQEIAQLISLKKIENELVELHEQLEGKKKKTAEEILDEELTSQSGWIEAAAKLKAKKAKELAGDTGAIKLMEKNIDALARKHLTD